MFDSISLQNFQSHSDSTIHFTPGVNVIIGESDSGKSAILRALRWVVWNRPQGDTFRSYWGGTSKVTLSINDTQITRKKTNTENSYQIDDICLKAFGSEPPEDVRTILNIDVSNFQQQLERPFLLDLSSGEIAQYFNRIAHLDMIDTGLATVQSLIRNIESDIKIGTNQKEQLLQQEEIYKVLPNIEMELGVVEEMERYKQHLQTTYTGLQKLIQNINKIQKEIDTTIVWLPLENILHQLFSTYKEQQTLTVLFNKIKYLETVRHISGTVSTTANTLEQLIKNKQGIIGIASLLQKIQTFTKEYSQLQTVLSLEDTVVISLQLIEKAKVTQQNMMALSGTITNINTVQKKIHEMDVLLVECETLFHKEFPVQCPLCGK